MVLARCARILTALTGVARVVLWARVRHGHDNTSTFASTVAPTFWVDASDLVSVATHVFWA